jgi:hypothetical protein
MPAPAGHATVAVIVANTPPEAANVNAAVGVVPPEGVPVRKAHTVLAEVASAADVVSGELIVKELVVVPTIVVGVALVVMDIALIGMMVSPEGTGIPPEKVHRVARAQLLLEDVKEKKVAEGAHT